MSRRPTGPAPLSGPLTAGEEPPRRCPGCGVMLVSLDAQHLESCSYQGPAALPFPVREIAGASHEARARRACALCSRTRLTTRTNVGPVCNDCLAGTGR